MGGPWSFNSRELPRKRIYNTNGRIAKICSVPGSAENLRAYMQAFSSAVRDIFESFDFHTQIDRLDKAGLLYLVTEKFANIDLHPDVISNDQMGEVHSDGRFRKNRLIKDSFPTTAVT